MTTIDSTAQTTAPTLAELTGEYEIDPTHSRLGFSAKHAMVTTVRGQFAEFTAEVRLDGADPTKSVAELTIDPRSITTGVAQRDEHLRSADFFDVEKFGPITFRSTGVEVLDEETFRMIGDLTIKDVTRPVTIDWTLTGVVIDPWGKSRAGFEGATTISRKDWGLSWNVALEAGGILVSDKIKLQLDVSAVKR